MRFASDGVRGQFRSAEMFEICVAETENKGKYLEICMCILLKSLNKDWSCTG